MKKLLLLTTGGTIASIQTEQGLVPETSGEEILSYVPEAEEICDIDVKQILNLDSTNLQPEHWLKIVREIRQNYETYDGFVVTHGTDTMAYTAAALSYLIQNSAKPVIITGAQKPISAPITDARKNLLDSVRFALKEGVHGVYIVFDGKAILGTRARKVRSKSYSAFESINYPVAAFIDENRILQYVEAEEKPREVEFYTMVNPRVFLLKLIPGMEPDILRYIGNRYDAIIIESYGVGGIPFYNKRNFLAELEQLTREGKIVVIATQVMLEGSDAEVYEVGFKAVNQYNILQAYDMTVEAAAVKLMWILARTREFVQVKEEFYHPVNHDILSV
ncbi:MAG: asparaginase [Clostridiales bacterium]|nr:asparaginase [Clostridiales bacterium]